MSESIRVRALPANATVYSVGGIKLGLVQSAEERIFCELTPLYSFGDKLPCAVSEGKAHYEIEIKKLAADDSIDIYSLSGFELCVTGEDLRVTYGGCRCKSISVSREAGKPRLETVVITATSREDGVWT